MSPSKNRGPQTPLNRISQPRDSTPDVLKLGVRSNNAKRHSCNNRSIYSQMKSPLSPDKDLYPDYINDQLSGGLKINEEEESIELAINKLLIVIENDESIDVGFLKETLTKCLFNLNHYKLQNQILRFNTVETMKRSEIENELMKKQIDQLVLKSPFVPRRVVERPHAVQAARVTKEYSLSKAKNPSPSATLNNIKLVEKHNSHQKETDFNHCIKVFHLEKS